MEMAALCMIFNINKIIEYEFTVIIGSAQMRPFSYQWRLPVYAPANVCLGRAAGA